MKRHDRILGAILAAVVLAFLLPGPALATVHSFSENFTTHDYHDTDSTTAWWDSTGGGEIKLWPFELERVGSCSTPGNLGFEVILAGEYAYVANGTGGLRVVDISDPTSPSAAGGFATFNETRGIDIAGNYAYLAVAYTQLLILDITDPTDPSYAASFDTLTTANDVEIAGNYAYVAEGGAGLRVMDITDPTVPRTASYYDTPGTAYAVAVEGNYAFVADGGSGLQIINITDPTALDFAGSYATPGTAYDVVVSGDYAYVADGSGGLQVINVKIPETPMFAGEYDPLTGVYFGVDVSGDYAYITEGAYGVHAIDISDPSTPVHAGDYGVGDISVGGVAVAEEYAYVGTSSDLWVVDIADRVSLKYCGEFPIRGPASGLEVSGNSAYVGDTDGCLWTINVTTPSSPMTQGSLSVAQSVLDVEVEGNYAYLGLYEGLLVVDVSDPYLPDSVGFWDNSGGGASWAMAVSGDLAFVGEAGTNKYVHVINISNPTDPSEISTFLAADYSSGMTIDGDYLFLAAQTTGLLIYDITDPEDVDSVGQFSTFGFANGVTVTGDYAFMSTTLGFQVVNIETPSSPTLLGTYPTTPVSCYWSVVRGDYAFVTTSTGMLVFDISNPTTLSVVEGYELGHWAGAVDVAGDHAFLSDRGGNKLQVIEVFQRQFDLDRNRAQSLVFFQSDDEISGIKLTPTKVDSVYFYISSDSGATWTNIPTDAQWHSLDFPGGDLLWRTEHFYRTYWTNPACSNLDIEWRYSFAEMDTVLDVPEDEGGWVRVRFDASGLDAAGNQGSQVPPMEMDGPGDYVNNYGIHRRIDDVGFVEELLEKGEPLEEETSFSVSSEEGAFELPSVLGGSHAYVLDGHYYYVSELPVSNGFPPGVWEAVGTVPATQEEQYYGLVPTAADSVAALVYTVYCVSAHTTDPLDYYFSPPDSGYSVDNLPPGAPQNLAGDYSYPPAQLLLTWDRRGERDFSHYAVYKGSDPDFVPDVGNRLSSPWDTFFVDTKFDPNVDNYYKVSAWDIHENEGEFSPLGPDGMSGVGETPGVPEVTLLEQNVPNPFNPVTVIRFAIAEPGRVKLIVYDVSGRPVRTLFDGVKGIDRYEIVWDGRDDEGRVIASGVYMYELDAPGYRESKKMVLLK